VPVALIETTRAPGDSVVLGVAPPPIGASGSSSLSATDNTAEVHVWTIPDAALPPGMCLQCPPSSALAPMSAREPPVLGCDTLAQALQALAASPLQTAMAPWLPRLAYASEADALNWRTGCHDLLTAPAFPIATCLPDVAATLGASTACLGAWGPLKPRQMRDIGLDPVCFSAKTAVRGMSLAHTVWGTFPFPVDTSGRLQQIYPVGSACFPVGTLPLPQASLGGATALSPDGRYVWIYWRLTSCCRDPARMGGQCAKLLPVTP
jgi:hypothetical protein